MSRILIIGPAWVGDMVMAQVLFKLLRQQNPTIVLDVVAPPSTLPLLSRMSEVKHAINLPLGHGELGLATRYKIGCELRAGHYDQAILLTNSFKSAILPFLTRASIRTGWRGEMRWGLVNDMRYLDKEKLPLMIQRFAALGLPADAILPAELPWPSLQVTKDSVTAALQKVNLTRPQKPVLVLCPGAEYGPAKRWPAAYFAAVAKAKLDAGWDIWLMGGPKDQIITTEIQALTDNRCVDLAGKTKLVEAVDLLSLATAVLTNDSGLMHISAALQRPLVVIYGSSSPWFTPPLTKHVKILSLNLDCSPCFERTCPLQHMNCLNHLYPEQVLQALTELVP